MIDDSVLHELLSACDDAAVETVRAGRGGPFAASLHVHDSAAGTMQTIAGPLGNAVLETGLASAHAEDRLVQPEPVAALKAALRAAGPEQAHVYAVSSGESCPACHAKLEILARMLVHENLLLPGRFTLVFGAGYAEAKAVAGFHDHAYHDDFQKPAGTGLVRQSLIKLRDLPAALRDKMMDVAAPLALIATRDKILAGTGEQPEISAIQFASKMQARAKIAEPWNLRGATLYSFTKDIGPLMYAECQWANVTRFVSVEHPEGPLYATQEAPGIANAHLFSVIARRPYDHPDSTMTFRQLAPFQNRAQQEWAKTPLGRYNGA